MLWQLKAACCASMVPCLWGFTFVDRWRKRLYETSEQGAESVMRVPWCLCFSSPAIWSKTLETAQARLLCLWLFQFQPGSAEMKNSFALALNVLQIYCTSQLKRWKLTLFLFVCFFSFCTASSLKALFWCEISKAETWKKKTLLFQFAIQRAWKSLFLFFFLQVTPLYRL